MTNRFSMLPVPSCSDWCVVVLCGAALCVTGCGGGKQSEKLPESAVSATGAPGQVESPPSAMDSATPPARPVSETSAATPVEESPAPAAENAAATESAPTREDVARTANGETIAITFDDLNLRMQADVAYRPWMLTDRAKELDGQRVRISGYIHAGISQVRDIKDFVLLRNTECKFGPGGQADHLIKVVMLDAASARYTTRPVQVEGTIQIDPFEGPDGNTWSIYTMRANSFKELRAGSIP